MKSSIISNLAYVLYGWSLRGAIHYTHVATDNGKWPFGGRGYSLLAFVCSNLIQAKFQILKLFNSTHECFHRRNVVYLFSTVTSMESVQMSFIL